MFVSRFLVVGWLVGLDFIFVDEAVFECPFLAVLRKADLPGLTVESGVDEILCYEFFELGRFCIACEKFSVGFAKVHEQVVGFIGRGLVLHVRFSFLGRFLVVPVERFSHRFTSVLGLKDHNFQLIFAAVPQVDDSVGSL